MPTEHGRSGRARKSIWRRACGALATSALAALTLTAPVGPAQAADTTHGPGYENGYGFLGARIVDGLQTYTGTQACFPWSTEACWCLRDHPVRSRGGTP